MPKISQYPSQSGAAVANGDLIPIVDVGSPNVTERIAVDELAQAPQFSSRYRPLAGDTIVVPAGAIGPSHPNPPTLAVFATPNFNWSGLTFNSTQDQWAGCNVWIPEHWATWHCDVYWSHGTVGGTGNVRWWGITASRTVGQTLDAGSGVAVTAAVTTEYFLNSTRLRTSVTGTGWTQLALARLGSDAADTFTGNASVVSVVFVRAT